MKNKFSEFVEWAGGKDLAAKRLEVSEALVRHILSGRRGVSKAVASKAHEVSGGKFDRASMFFSD